MSEGGACDLAKHKKRDEPEFYPYSLDNRDDLKTKDEDATEGQQSLIPRDY